MHIPTVLSSFLLWICATSLQDLVSSSAVSYCLDIPYYQTNALCCGDKLYPRALNRRCCEDSGEVYDAARQVCCGTVKNVSRPWSMGCCKNNGKATIFNRSNQACCMGNLYNTKTQFELSSGQVIEEDIPGFCCGASFVDTSYDGNYMKCCYDPEYPTLSKPYNASQNVCCGRDILPRDGMDQCCGRNTYNPQEEVCCYPNGSATIYPATGYGPNQCCAKAPGGVISQSTHVCIDDEPYERQCFPQSYKSPSSTLGCCAGYIKFNTTTHHCCGRRVLPYGTECCRGEPVLVGQVCCGPDHGAMAVSNPGDNSCCYRPAFWQTYNNKTQTCRHGVVKQRTTCGGQAFNPAKMLCCEGELYARIKGYRCCGKRLYTPKYLTCCNGQRIQGAKRQCPQ